ncbi:hypothetical protein PJP10_32535, partial [Mycobacterium kansasii]
DVIKATFNQINLDPKNVQRAKAKKHNFLIGNDSSSAELSDLFMPSTNLVTDKFKTYDNKVILVAGQPIGHMIG